MKIKYLLVAICALAFAACSNEEIDTWKGKGYIWFPTENIDFTFVNHPDVAVGGSYLVGIPFTTATTKENYDREVGVEVSRNASDQRTKYEIQKPVLFHANHIVDTLWVKVYNSEHLKQVHDTITFKIVPNSNFDPGLEDKTTANLCLFNGYARPQWWNSAADYTIGYFTQLKMQVYWTVIGNDDDPREGQDSWLFNPAVMYKMRILNDYITEHDIRYPADDPYAPGQRPKFGSMTY